jgi:uncharacterized protein (DUF924 family)
MLAGGDDGDGGGPHSSGAPGGRGIGSAEEVLGFWFAPGGEGRWFKPDPAFDAEIRRRFAPLVEEAGAGRLDGWGATPDGAVALCLLLDQFPRNIWRGTPRAFAHDPAARRVAGAALAAGHDARLPPPRRLFLYLPFEHSEDPADQDRSCALIAGLGDAEWLDYARRHRDVVARFGRFPHRNAILGRASTAEEARFLQQPGSSF